MRPSSSRPQEGHNRPGGALRTHATKSCMLAERLISFARWRFSPTMSARHRRPGGRAGRPGDSVDVTETGLSAESHEVAELNVEAPQSLQPPCVLQRSGPDRVEADVFRQCEDG